MRGSIRRRGNGYTIVYDVGRRWDEEGQCWKRKQKWEKVTAPDTKKHAEELLAERLSEIHGGTFFEPTKISFGEFVQIWLARYARGEGQIRHSTLVQYDGFFRNHLLPCFEDVQLTSITVEDIQDFKVQKLSEGLSPQTVKHLLRLLRQMLEHALVWQYVRLNPAKQVRMPRVPQKTMRVLSPAEVRSLLDASEEPYRTLFLTAVVSGLRIGEILAMRWANLDLDKGQYHVREAWLRPRAGKPASFGVPKTPSSVAPVDITPSCCEALHAHRRTQAEEMLKAGSDYHHRGLIFATASGTPLDPWNLTKRAFYPALEAAGLPRLRLHDLRHTCASLLISQGESAKYVAHQLRHSSVQITLDRYSHLFPEDRSRAAERLDAVLLG